MSLISKANKVKMSAQRAPGNKTQTARALKIDMNYTT